MFHHVWSMPQYGCRGTPTSTAPRGIAMAMGMHVCGILDRLPDHAQTS